MSQLSESTGGESFSLGVQSPVSLQPYLNKLQTVLRNQYLLSFAAIPGSKPELQTVKLKTEVAGVELAAPDAVWVPAASR